MASETFSAIASITVCFFLVCNATTVTTGATTTLDHSATLLNTEKSIVNITETTGSPALDVTNTTISNTNTSSLNASEPTQFSPSTAAATPVNVSGSQNTVNVSGSSTLKTTVTSTSLSSSTAPLTGPSASSENPTSSTAKSAVTVTQVLSTPPPTQVKPTPKSNGTEATPNTNATNTLSDTEKHSMKYPEIILTSIFSTTLVVVLLVILSVVFKRCVRGRSQYSHHPLHETSYESDRYSAPDDTLVISGGLYDAPRIYNPNMTVLEDEESQNDYTSFNSRPGQFKLEFLPGDKDMDPVLNGSQTRNV